MPDSAWIDRVLTYREARRLFWDVQWLRFRRQRPGVPVFVVGGERDFALTEDSLRSVAAFHGAPLSMVAGAPHDLMLTHPQELAKLLEDLGGRVETDPTGLRGENRGP